MGLLDLDKRDDRLVVAWLMSLVVGAGLSEGLTVAQALRLWVEDGPATISVDGAGAGWMARERLAWAASLSPDDVLPELPELPAGRR